MIFNPKENEIEEIKNQIEEKYFFYYENDFKFLPCLKYKVKDVKKSYSIKKNIKKRIFQIETEISEKMIKKLKAKLSKEDYKKITNSTRLFVEKELFEIELELNRNPNEYPQDDYLDFINQLKVEELKKLFIIKFEIYLNTSKQDYLKSIFNKTNSKTPDFYAYDIIKKGVELVKKKYLIRNNKRNIKNIRVGEEDGFEECQRKFRKFMLELIRKNLQATSMNELKKHNSNLALYLDYLEKYYIEDIFSI